VRKRKEKKEERGKRKEERRKVRTTIKIQQHFTSLPTGSPHPPSLRGFP
jgi:hypothetical protein